MRRRILAPELWTDGRVLRLGSDLGKLVFVGLISQSDDEGLVEADATVLRAALGLRASVAKVEAALEDVIAAGLAVAYRVDGQTFAFLPRFFRHQTLDRPTPSRHPRPPGDLLAKFPAYVEERRKTFDGPHSRHQGYIFDKGAQTPSPGLVPDMSRTCPAEPKRNETKTDSRDPQAGHEREAVPYGEIVKAWNDLAAGCGLPVVKEATEKRRTAIRARWGTEAWRENWRSALAAIPSRAFLMGGGSRSWRADFDFFLRPDTVTRIIEGAYQDGQGAASLLPPEPR